MKKQITNKLTLSREIVRSMQDDKLEAVVGARPRLTGVSCEDYCPRPTVALSCTC